MNNNEDNDADNEKYTLEITCSFPTSDAWLADALLATRAFGIIGLLLLVACVVVAVLLFFMDNKLFMLIAANLGFVAGT